MPGQVGRTSLMLKVICWVEAQKGIDLLTNNLQQKDPVSSIGQARNRHLDSAPESAMAHKQCRDVKYRLHLAQPAIDDGLYQRLARNNDA